MAYHFVVNLMEMNFTDFVNYIFAFKSNKSEASVSIGLFVKHEHGVFNLEVKINLSLATSSSLLKTSSKFHHLSLLQIANSVLNLN